MFFLCVQIDDIVFNSLGDFVLYKVSPIPPPHSDIPHTRPHAVRLSAGMPLPFLRKETDHFLSRFPTP